jgi:hypothetical protein
MKKTNKSVPIDAIANLLPVNKWFSKAEFCKLTGVVMSSCGPRLYQMSISGYLDNMPSGARSLIYKMTADSKSRMILRGRANKKTHGRRYAATAVNPDELKAQLEQYSFLRSVKFV